MNDHLDNLQMYYPQIYLDMLTKAETKGAMTIEDFYKEVAKEIYKSGYQHGHNDGLDLGRKLA